QRPGNRPGPSLMPWRISALRLRGDLAGGRRRRTRLAGGRHRRGARAGRLDHALAYRPLAREQVLDLVAGQRLELDQAARQRLEVGALVGEDLLGLRQAGFDQAAHFAIDLAAGLFRDVVLARHLIAEKYFVLV